MRRPRPSTAPETARDEKGSALVFCLMVATTLSGLGISYLTLGESVRHRALMYGDRERTRSAARDVLAVAATWFNTTETGLPTLPESKEWITSERRGDSDDDGEDDAACDGSRPNGALAWKTLGGEGPFDPKVRAGILDSLCGSAEHPDLVLEGSRFNEDLAALLGEGVIVERIAVHAPPRANGQRLALASVTCTISVQRGQARRAIERASAHVVSWPAPRGPEVLAANGSIALSPGSTVHWGVVQAGRDLTLPPPGVEGFPASGLPRAGDGRRWMDFSPVTSDWKPSTPEKAENLLTELLGQTDLGTWRKEGPADPPHLPDPWLSLRAGTAFTFEPAPRKEAARHAERQPFTYRLGDDLRDDRSQISVITAPGFDALLDGSLATLARAACGAEGTAGQARHYLLDGETEAGEPLWSPAGGGPSRTAAEWLRRADDAPAVSVFDDLGSPPRRVRLYGGSGIVVLRAETVELRGGRRPVTLPVSMPGEPFLDQGIDLDHDGILEKATVGNGSWDVDSDSDGEKDVEPEELDELFERMYGDMPWDGIPLWGMDPRTLPDHPHEAFLNLEYPRSTRDLSVRVVPMEGRFGTGMLRGRRGGEEELTGMSRDEHGAEIEMPLHFRGVVANLGGNIVVGAGFRMHGALRASGDISLEPASFVSFDEELLTRGWPADLPLPAASLADFVSLGLKSERSVALRRPGTAQP